MLTRSVLLIAFFIIFKTEFLEANKSNRQKRCIVVQKQSGSRDIDDDDYDQDYSAPQPKDPRPDRLLAERPAKKYDFERLPPLGLIKMKKPNWKQSKQNFRNKLI